MCLGSESEEEEGKFLGRDLVTEVTEVGTCQLVEVGRWECELVWVAYGGEEGVCDREEEVDEHEELRD